VVLLWSKLTFVQFELTWQSSQVLDDWMWVAFLPGAIVPLWQVEQVAVVAA
jgi:hypothetical protein